MNENSTKAYVKISEEQSSLKGVKGQSPITNLANSALYLKVKKPEYAKPYHVNATSQYATRTMCRDGALSRSKSRELLTNSVSCLL